MQRTLAYCVRPRPSALVVCACLGLACGQAGESSIDFEGLPDGAILTTQYPAVVFTNAIILTAGISLNELEFPPHSGVNVASDYGGPMTVAFSSPVHSFSGHFTYGRLLTMQSFGAASSAVASMTSRFGNNEALSGAPGSSPNELLSATYAAGISHVTITGDPAGESFALDDVSFSQTLTEPVPLLSTPAFVALALALAGLGGWAVRKGKGAVGSGVAVVLLLVLPFRFQGQPQTIRRDVVQARIDSVDLSRSAIPRNHPTWVSVTARITQRAQIPGSVNLIRYDPSGVPKVVGRSMASPSSGVYIFQTHLNEPTSGPIHLRVSAAFHGRMRRVLSAPMTITVTDEQ